MVTLEQFRGNVASNLSGLLLGQVDSVIQWAAYDFATRTGCQREFLKGFYVEQLQAVSIDSEFTGSHAFKVLDLTADGSSVAIDGGVNDGLIKVRTIIDSTADIVVDVLSRPAMEATVFSDQLAQRYQSALIHGALYKGHMIGGGEWYNPQLSQFNYQQYQSAIMSAKRDTFNDRGLQTMNNKGLI